MGPQEKSAVVALKEALKDKEVKSCASQALRQMGVLKDKDAISLLMTDLKGGDLGARLNATSSLGDIGPEAKACCQLS